MVEVGSPRERRLPHFFPAFAEKSPRVFAVVATLEDDVDFYTLVHHLCGGSEASRNRRAAARRPFACKQWVAPVFRDETPGEEAYAAVQCRDISTSGFSYVAPFIPQRESISVRLGLPGTWLYLAARVTNCREIDTEEGPRVLVGCQFLSRE